jgi:hypothetical protein
MFTRIHIDEVPKVPVDIYYKDQSSLVLAKSVAENLPSGYSVNLRQRYLDDTALASIYYFSPDKRTDAFDAATAVNNLLGRNIQPQQADSLKFTQWRAGIVIYVNRSNQPVTCTPLAVSALPESLTEIWVGGTSRRFINVNIAQRLIYYSNDNGRTFTKYRINDVCLAASGAYRVIVGDNAKRYKLVFFKNVKQQSFELSICEGFAKTMQELQDKDETYCDRFNVMRWYYEDIPGRIYLPVNGASLAAGEKQKLDRKTDSLGKDFLY